jgi:hypothetical protein
MTKILNQEVLEERARNLGSLNGFKLLFVTLEPAGAPTHAWLDVEFHNSNELSNILADITGSVILPAEAFPLSGGTRIKAGAGPGQVQVAEVAAGAESYILRLRVEPIGDYSTYTLRVVYDNIDPVFGEIAFKFRPGCFNLNCAPEWTPSPPRPAEPLIDYLAKDYDSFKHVLITAMQERVPRWQPTSEADLDQVLIDLLAADADESSDFQDRVVSEGYLASARKRLSLARHARLMDYHIHQGNQATGWLALKVSTDVVVPTGFGVWTGKNWNDPGAIIFISQDAQSCSSLLNELALYHWDGLVTALEAGATEADLRLPASLDPTSEADADLLRDLFRAGTAPHLLIQERLNPETGTVNGRDIHGRQILRLLEGFAAAESMQDPLAGDWFVRVHWREEDKLKRRYCFLSQCSGQPLEERVSLFHGNLVRIAHGRPHRSRFLPPGAILAGADDSAFIATGEAHFELTKWGVICVLPHTPLAYRKTPPGGETPPQSTLTVTVSGFADPWEEQSDLIESEADDEHFMVETDEYSVSRARFGNSVNGRALPENSVVTCLYQVGQGAGGNVGSDKLTAFDAVAHPEVTEVWNPLDVTDGRDPEPREEIVRRVPEAYRYRQLRAVTLEDYANRAEELPGVAHAAARYAWTGSWRTVRIAIDPKSTTVLDETLRKQIEDYLNAVRLIGEDLEVRPAEYVPLDIEMRLCAHPDYWPEDLDAVLQQEFSDGYTPDGRPGFFHPDSWTFGQPLYASQLIGRALAVPGTAHMLALSIRRWQGRAGPSLTAITIAPEDLLDEMVEKIEVSPFEILQVANDPNHLEKGRIQFEILGGRQ